MLAGRIASMAMEHPSRCAAIWNTQRFSYQQMAQIIGTLQQTAPPPAGPNCVAALLIGNLLIEWCWLVALRSLGYTTLSIKDVQSLFSMDIDNATLIVADNVSDIAAIYGLKKLAAPTVMRASLPSLTASRMRGDGDDGPCGGHILLSSGTTGLPKKVLVTKEGDIGDVELHRAIMPKTADTRYLIGSFFLSTAAGYRGPLRTWAAGGAVIFNQRADRSRPFHEIDRITDADFTPQSLKLLLNSLGDAPAKPGMRLNILGGAASWALICQTRRMLTDDVYSLFGATEAGVIAQRFLGSESDLGFHDVVQGRRAGIVDDNGKLRSEGEVGALRIEPAPGIDGYMGDEATTKTFFKDGFFYTGDLARWVGKNSFELVGRSSAVIHLDGNKVSPEPIEQRLKSTFNLSDVCVFSAPVVGGEDAIHIFIEGDEISSRDEMGRIRKAASIIKVVEFHFIKEFPRNDLGKVVRMKLKDRILS